MRSLWLFGDGTTVAVRVGEETARESFEDTEAGVIESSGHWVAEENPRDLAAKVLEFIGKGR